MDSAQHTLHPAPHPGEMVVEYLEFHGWSQSDLARRTGLTPKTISEICNSKAPITPPTALALEKVFQRPAHLWLNLQRQFDEADARRRQDAKSSSWKEWASHFPVQEMRKRQWLPLQTPSDVDAVLIFLGVSSPESWNAVWRASSVAYRQTRRFEVSPEAVAAWVRRTEVEANEIATAPFDEARLSEVLDELRHCTRLRVEKALGQAQALCAATGVALVCVPELSHTGISGCARWLTNTKALVALTLRYKTDDQLWFTFFHEVGHLLLHRHKRDFVLDNAAEELADNVVDPEMTPYEEEANRFSRDTLIPPSTLADFIKANEFTSKTIQDFSERVGIGPGIVVGRLQHEGLLEHFQGNAFKQKLNWGIREGDQ